MENTQIPATTHLLDDIEYQYVQASANVRFCNLLVDRLLLFGLWYALTTYFAYPVGMFIYSIAGNERVLQYLISYAMVSTLHVLYFSCFEIATGGKTLGKLFTRTRAVNENGTRITAKAAVPHAAHHRLSPLIGGGVHG
jgi:uncharacterized RDD family membrane protein YckC